MILGDLLGGGGKYVFTNLFIEISRSPKYAYYWTLREEARKIVWGGDMYKGSYVNALQILLA